MKRRRRFIEPLLRAFFLWTVGGAAIIPSSVGAASHQLDLSGVRIAPSEQAPLGSVGLMFCLDISGSMGAMVGEQRKIDASKAAMRQVFAHVAAHMKSSPDTVVKVGLCSFSASATVLHPLGPFDESRLVRSIQDLQPTSSTAIGAAMTLALRELMKAGVESKAIIVMTDGENTRGVQPDQVMRAIRRNDNTQKALTDDVKVFLIAFDVNAQVFEKVKAAGAAVLESRDSASLAGILTSVVEEVLLEKSR